MLPLLQIQTQLHHLEQRNPVPWSFTSIPRSHQLNFSCPGRDNWTVNSALNGARIRLLRYRLFARRLDIVDVYIRSKSQYRQEELIFSAGPIFQSSFRIALIYLVIYPSKRFPGSKHFIRLPSATQPSKQSSSAKLPVRRLPSLETSLWQPIQFTELVDNNFMALFNAVFAFIVLCLCYMGLVAASIVKSFTHILIRGFSHSVHYSFGLSSFVYSIY